MIRIWRTPLTVFGGTDCHSDGRDDETVTALGAYTDEILAGIAGDGFNGIWVHGLLHHLVKAAEFPEFGEFAGLHQEKLRRLIERAARYGIKVYIYMQPPRALPLDDRAFWDRHADVAGQAEIVDGEPGRDACPVRALCTSTAKVQAYLEHAAADLAAALPGLGGVIMITASEFPAHCYSRRGRVLGAGGETLERPIECPRCAARPAYEVIAEVVSRIRDGVKAVAPEMAVIAWNWSWSFFVDIPCVEVIERLPRDVIVMADFERGGWRTMPGGRRLWIDEYSIGYPGPSEQFRSTLEVTRRLGMEQMAKLQFGSTHEIASVPNLPALGNLFAKADFLKRNHLAGYMGCWNIGNMLSANSAGFNYFLSPEAPAERDAALEAFAGRYFPGCDAVLVRRAWLKFGEALEHYPFGIPYLYMGPTNWALSFVTRPAPLNGEPGGRSWIDDPRGDRLEAGLLDFTASEVAGAFAGVAAAWSEGVELLSAGLAKAEESRHREEELGNAAVVGAAFVSTANLFRVYLLRLEWRDDRLPEYREIIAGELENCRVALPWLEKDPRLGFHSEAHAHMFDAGMVRAKIAALENQLA